MLNVQTTKPDMLLQPFISWYVQRELVPSDGEFIEPVVPRIATMLEFQFAAIYQVQVFGTDLLRPSWATTIIGPIDARKVRLVLCDRVESLVVMFRPMGLYRLFTVPISPFKGAGAEGHAVFGPQMSSLYERLGNIGSFAKRTTILDGFFLNRLKCSVPLHPAARALHLLTSSACSVRAAANLAGTGERQFERRSLDLAGLSPKVLARVSRFQRAIHRRKISRASWLDVAHEIGYYDQMHMIRDFHDLAGGSPMQVFDEIKDNHLISWAFS